MGSIAVDKTPVVPKTCVGAVVKNEGPDFYVEIEELPVPEISLSLALLAQSTNN